MKARRVRFDGRIRHLSERSWLLEDSLLALRERADSLEFPLALES